MKKVITSIIALAMIVSLCACGNNNATISNGDVSGNTSSESSETALSDSETIGNKDTDSNASTEGTDTTGSNGSSEKNSNDKPNTSNNSSSVSNGFGLSASLKKSGGKATLDLTTDKMDTLSGNIVGLQFTVNFTNATYSSLSKASYPSGWVADITDKDTANSAHQIKVLMLDNDLKTCFPNQKVGTITFDNVTDSSKFTITDIKFVYYENNDFNKIADKTQKSFTVK